MSQTRSSPKQFFIAFGFEGLADENAVTVPARLVNNCGSDSIFIDAPQGGPTVFVVQPNQLARSDINTKLKPKFAKDDFVLLFHSRHFDSINKAVQQVNGLSLIAVDGSLEASLTVAGLDKTGLVKDIVACADPRPSASQVVIKEMYAMTETTVVDPIAQVLDQFFWVNSAVRQVLFYSAVYAASGGKPENAYAYLEKRIPGLEGILTALPETIIDDPATAHLNKANKIFEQVGKLTKRDFGYLPDHFATRADNVFHDSPQTRSVFLDDLTNVWHDTLHVKHGLGYTDVTQRILGTSIENARIVLLDHAPEAWSVVSLFTTDIGNFYTLATAFACLHLIRASAGQASQADDAYCLVVAPSFNLQAVRYSSRLGNGVSLIDATGIWQMQHKLSDKSKAAEVARRLPEFLVHHHGLLNIEAAFAALGID